MSVKLVATSLAVVAVVVTGSLIVAQWNNNGQEQQASGHSHSSDTAHDDSTHNVSSDAVDADSPLAGAKCPISTAQVLEKHHCEYRGVTLYFCCGHCPTAFGRSRDKFIADANAQLVATGQARQLKCPLTGKAVDPTTEISVDGVKVAFCCDDCQQQALQSQSAARAELVFNDEAFERGFQVVQVASRGQKIR